MTLDVWNKDEVAIGPPGWTRTSDICINSPPFRLVPTRESLVTTTYLCAQTPRISSDTGHSGT